MNLETKMYFFNKIIVFFITLALPVMLTAQDCTLNVGGEKADMLIGVFQLNDSQVKQMEMWRAEFSVSSKLIEDDIQQLFDTHPQSTPQELTDLAAKYEVYKAKLVAESIRTDKLLVAIFNEKQYKRYVELCHEAVRKPFKVTPVPLEAPVVDPE